MGFWVADDVEGVTNVTSLRLRFAGDHHGRRCYGTLRGG